MSIIDFIFDNYSFKDVLNDYRKQVKEKKYKASIPYQTWKELMTTEKVCLNYRIYRSDWEILNGNTKSTLMKVDFNTGFDKYLYNTFIKPLKEEEKEEKEMPKYTFSSGESSSLSSSIYLDNNTQYIDTGVVVNTLGDFTTTTKAINISELSDKVDTFEAWMNTYGNQVKATCNCSVEPNREDKNMKMFNIEFGPVTSNDIAISVCGLSIKNNVSEWVHYNAKDNKIVNVNILNLKNSSKYVYKMPIAVSKIAAGDIVMHNGEPVFITEVSETATTFKVVSPKSGETKEIIPTTNLFGFNFLTKIICIFDGFMGEPSNETPFGNMLPLLMMNDNNGDIDPLAMCMMMNGEGKFDFDDMMSNPMMMYFLMKDSKGIDPMMLMFMMNKK